MVVLKGLVNEEVTEHSTQVRIPGLVFEAKRTDVIEVKGKFLRKTVAEFLNCNILLPLQNELRPSFITCNLESLPWEGAANKVYQYIAKGLHIIATRLLFQKLSYILDLEIM